MNLLKYEISSWINSVAPFPGGDSPEKCEGVLDGTVWVWNSDPAHLLVSTKSSRPSWHLLGSDFVL